MAIKQNIRNSLLTSNTPYFMPTNVPSRYSNKRKSYYEAETRRFEVQYAKYSSDYTEARIQGLYAEEPNEWTTILLRFSEIVKPNSAIQRNFDDYKMVKVINPHVEYLPVGAKLECLGNTWLVVNPANMSDGAGVSLIRRCNTVWNYHDYYGNVCSEPLILDSYLSHFNTNNLQETSIMIKGYFNVLCQYNEATKQLQSNSRMILGRNTYIVTGYADFMQEFTGDYDTVRMIMFTVRFEETNLEIDDMENHVAGGLAYSWDVAINGTPNITVGEESKLSATSTRLGSKVESSKLHPISYLWESSDEEVATVAEDGTVTGVAEGECEIRCFLKQNTDKYAVYNLTVAGVSTEPRIAFVGTVTSEINMYDSTTISATYYEDGLPTEEVVEWYFDGAVNGYNYSVKIENNSATITCWNGSPTPLTITAYCKEQEISTDITLSSLLSSFNDIGIERYSYYEGDYVVKPSKREQILDTAGKLMRDDVKVEPVEDIAIDDTLKLTDGVLGVNTTDEVQEDNTRPITSAAVYTEVGNIDAILESI